MRKIKQLSARIAVVAGAATLLAASAFADSRPSDETSWRDRNRGDVRRDGDRDRDDERRRDDSRNGRDRDDDRGRYENDGRYDRDRGYESSHDRRPYQTSGRISQVDRFRNGYRVYVGGARYPFFVPDRYYRRDRFRVGVVINIGGYYNPAGYYDYYERRGGHSRADLRGVVESVDRRRDTFVIRTVGTGRFVTVVSRDRRNVRRGDYVELYGDWSRRGVFRADDVDLIDRY